MVQEFLSQALYLYPLILINVYNNKAYERSSGLDCNMSLEHSRKKECFERWLSFRNIGGSGILMICVIYITQ
jgi:hypothetical protein